MIRFSTANAGHHDPHFSRFVQMNTLVLENCSLPTPTVLICNSLPTIAAAVLLHLCGREHPVPPTDMYCLTNEMAVSPQTHHPYTKSSHTRRDLKCQDIVMIIDFLATTSDSIHRVTEHRIYRVGQGLYVRKLILEHKLPKFTIEQSTYKAH